MSFLVAFLLFPFKFNILDDSVLKLIWIMCPNGRILLQTQESDVVLPFFMIAYFPPIFRCFFFGDTTSKRDPTAYLEYIHALFDYYRKVYYMLDNSENTGNAGMPLVINTPGWVKGGLFVLLFF